MAPATQESGVLDNVPETWTCPRYLGQSVFGRTSWISYSSTSHFPQQILALVKNLSFLSTKISTNQSIPITSGNQSTIHYIPSNIPRYYHKFPAYCTTSCAPRHRFLTQQIPKVILLQRSAIKIQTLLLNMDFHAGRCKTACPVNFLLFFPSPRTISSSNSFRGGSA